MIQPKYERSETVVTHAGLPTLLGKVAEMTVKCRRRHYDATKRRELFIQQYDTTENGPQLQHRGMLALPDVVPVLGA